MSVYISNYTLLTEQVGRGGTWYSFVLCDVEDEYFKEDRSERGGGHETYLNCTQKAMSRRRENDGGMGAEATRSKGTKRERRTACVHLCA